jgi:hypothetical protein
VQKHTGSGANTPWYWCKTTLVLVQKHTGTGANTPWYWCKTTLVLVLFEFSHKRTLVQVQTHSAGTGANTPGTGVNTPWYFCELLK